jgi:ribosomal protein S18 acetylase RimI-like enzyme
MSEPGFLWFAGLSAAVALTIWWTSRHRNLTGRYRALKNHLKEFNNLWIALVFYYAIQSLWPRFSAAAKHPLWNALPYLRYVTPSFIWHLMIALLLACANLWLRRAGLELEISQLPGNEGKILFPETLSPLWQRLLKLPERYIGLFFGVAVLLLVVGIFPANASWAPIWADNFQVLVNSALFISLSFAYSNILRARWIAHLSWIYGLAQLPYSFYAGPGELTPYSQFLGALKIIYGITLCLTVYRFAQLHPDGHEDDARHALERVAKRLNAHAYQQPLFQLIIATAGLSLWVLAILSVYTFVLDALETRFHWVFTGMVRALFLLPLLVGAQFLLYFVAARLRYRVSWGSLAEGVLKPLFTVTTHPSDDLAPALHRLTVQRAAGAERAASPQDDIRQIILLHGFMNDGAGTWGLLPVLLLDRPFIERVHVVTYKHRLYTTRKGLETIARELRIHIRTLMTDYEGSTILIGHSLGAILLLLLIPDLLKDAVAVQKYLRHLCLVGPPLLGSPFAKLAFPSPISWLLGRHSSFLAQVLRDAAEDLPPAGSPANGERLRPSMSLIPGTRDEVVGSLIQFTILPAKVVEAPGFHGLGMAFLERQELTRAYFRVLAEPCPAETLARQVAQSLGLWTAGEGGILRLTGETLDSAMVVSGMREDTLIDNSVGGEKPFKSTLERYYRATGQVNTGDWEAFWRSLSEHVAERSRPVVVTTPWHNGRTLLLYLNRVSGCFGICSATTPDEAVVHERGVEKLGVGAQLLRQRYPALNIGGTSGALAETCGHLEPLRAQGIAFSGLAARAAIDRRGTYYGVYSLHGKVTARQGITRVLVHLGADVTGRRAGDLAFSAFDEHRHAPLEVAEKGVEQHCYLITLDAGRAYNHGEEIAIRFSFRQPECVSTERDVDCFKLYPLLQEQASVSVELHLPDRCRSNDGFVLRESDVRELAVEVVAQGGSHSCVLRAAHAVQRGELAMGLTFSLEPGPGLRRLADLVKIGEARKEEPGQLAALEAILAVGNPATEVDFARRLGVFREGVIVARLSEMVVGYVDYIRWSKTDLTGLTHTGLIRLEEQHVPDGKYAFIRFVGVLAAFRGGDIASVLLTEVADAARLAGATQVQIVVLPETFNLFRVLGYEQIGRLENYLPERGNSERAGLLLKRSLV